MVTMSWRSLRSCDRSANEVHTAQRIVVCRADITAPSLPSAIASCLRMLLGEIRGLPVLNPGCTMLTGRHIICVCRTRAEDGRGEENVWRRYSHWDRLLS